MAVHIPWDHYFSGDTNFEVVFCGGGEEAPLAVSPERRNDLWHEAKMFNYGPKGNLKEWMDAAKLLDQFVEMGAQLGNDAVVHALIDARSRAREEARRAESEVTMRRQWAEGQPTEADLL